MSIIFRRRAILLGGVVLSGTMQFPALSLSDVNSDRPDDAVLLNGDLVWPKRANQYVPYQVDTRSSSSDPKRDEAQWNADKAAFLTVAKQKLPYLNESELDHLQSMSFSEFYSRYAGARSLGGPPLEVQAMDLYVGHVGIIEIDNAGNRFVIEALLGSGVIRQPYTDWLAKRPGELVWLGRIRGLDAPARDRFLEETKRYLGRPYDFWNFDLNDDRAFYCSKLVWLTAFRALGFPLDGDANPKRAFWFSPKQLLYSNRVDRIFEPRKY
jgi:hypothetical protein